MKSTIDIGKEFSLIDRKKVLNSQKSNTVYNADSIIGHTDEAHDNSDEVQTQEEWFTENIPFIDTPDIKLNDVYYYRWSILLSALAKRKSDGKYEFCEAAPGSGYHKFIDCAEGAHIRDARWIKNRKYLNDYLDITPDNTVYREYITDSVWQKYLLDGDLNCISKNYEKLKKRLSSLNNTFSNEFGLYHSTNNIEGQECGVNGFDRLEKHFSYSASFTSAGSSLEALTDNLCCDKIWSATGSGNEFDFIEITSDLNDFKFSGARIWFHRNPECNIAEPKAVTFYEKVGDTLNRIENVTVSKPKHPAGCVEFTFNPVESKTIRIEFQNEISSGMYTGISELVACFYMKPWTDEWWIVTAGYESYRVGLNSYQAAAMLALSKMAEVLNKSEEANEFKHRFENILSTILKQLWNTDEHFFCERIVENNEFVTGKELCGYAPWLFSLVPDETEFNSAFAHMTSEDGFLSKFGLTSLERNNPHYMQTFSHGCLWNGPVWPYTFSMALTALANHLQNSNNALLTKSDYYNLLSRYILCHHEDNSDEILAVKEDHHPDENHWIASSPYYNHSTFIDNVISGLFGIQPTINGIKITPLIPDEWEYFCIENLNIKSHDYLVFYDKYGTVYNKGVGLNIFRDGEKILSKEKLGAVEISF